MTKEQIAKRLEELQKGMDDILASNANPFPKKYYDMKCEFNRLVAKIMSS